MTFRKFLSVASILAAVGITKAASADVLWDNRGAGIDAGVALFFSTSPEGTAPGAIFSNYDPLDPISFPKFNGVLEDGTLAGGVSPYSVTGIRLGYYNAAAGSNSLGATVQFYDTVNYNASGTIATTPIGSPIALSFVANSGLNETGLLALPGGPLLLPDNTFGIAVVFNDANTHYLFRNAPLVAGTSSEFFGIDDNTNGVYTDLEIATWLSDPYPAANLYMELQGTAVPEPGSLALIGLGGLALVRRRRA